MWDDEEFEEDLRYPGFPRRVREVCLSCPFYFFRTSGMYVQFNTACRIENASLLMNDTFFRANAHPGCVRLLEHLVMGQK